MLPDAGAGEALTHTWWLALMALFACTIITGVITGITMLFLSRSLKRRDVADAKQDVRIRELGEQMSQRKLELLEREQAHQARIHQLELSIVECQKEYCSQKDQYISREEHHGDILRIQTMIVTEFDKVMSAISEVHRRVDDVLINGEAVNTR